MYRDNVGQGRRRGRLSRVMAWLWRGDARSWLLSHMPLGWGAWIPGTRRMDIIDDVAKEWRPEAERENLHGLPEAELTEEQRSESLRKFPWKR